MGLFDDFSRFLEERLDEYLRNNPHLELFVLEEKLREQEEETLTLMTDLKRQEKQVQDEIMGIAREIQLWHARIEKAKAAGRADLAEPAQAHEASLLRQGNQKWGQMEMLKERIQQTQELQKKIEVRRKELQTKVSEAQATRSNTRTTQAGESFGWNQSSTANSGNLDALEKQFRRWEAEEELQQLKRNMGR
ncbi:TIGR04376 family protein [Kovacikia minuta CCNUW1]|uniref:TIGR04376 family protein n=1 Tax=Kovacikia minuta TaxID=2931930 RepID=UPI001CCB2AE5|nr:TIGR04376 family protein [Kovacikia minuta]UBF29025.1 TIGR04376 family protein [Kovacikia minuta CCNUW1]